LAWVLLRRERKKLSRGSWLNERGKDHRRQEEKVIVMEREAWFDRGAWLTGKKLMVEGVFKRAGEIKIKYCAHWGKQRETLRKRN